MNEFPHKITFQIKSDVPDGSGGYITDWVLLKESDAHVMDISGDTYYFAQQNKTRITHKVFMEFDEEITSNLRIIHGNEILTIKSPPIDQGGLGEVMVLMCESGGK